MDMHINLQLILIQCLILRLKQQLHSNSDIPQIWRTAGQIGYDLMIDCVKPIIELNKIYYCDIIYARNYSSNARYYYTRTKTRMAKQCII